MGTLGEALAGLPDRRTRKKVDLPLERIGLEACSLAAWLHDGIRAEGLPAICIETRQANAAIKTMPNSPAPWRRSCAPAGIDRCM